MSAWGPVRKIVVWWLGPSEVADDYMRRFIARGACPYNPLLPIYGDGPYSVLFVRFEVYEESRDYSSFEHITRFSTRAERDAHVRELRREHKRTRSRRPLILPFEAVQS